MSNANPVRRGRNLQPKPGRPSSSLQRGDDESWPHFFDRLRSLARFDCRNRGVPFVDPLPFHSGKLLQLGRMPAFIQLPAVAWWHANRQLAPDQANRAIAAAWNDEAHFGIPTRLLVSTFRHAGFVSGLPGLALDDLPPAIELFRTDDAERSPAGLVWCPNAGLAAGLVMMDAGYSAASVMTSDLESLLDGLPRNRPIYRACVPREHILGVLPVSGSPFLATIVDWERISPDDSAIEELRLDGPDLVRMARACILASLSARCGYDREEIRRRLEENGWVQAIDLLDEASDQFPFARLSPTEYLSGIPSVAVAASS